MEKPIQDNYPDSLSFCYGCGRLNELGLHIQSFWDGEVGICKYTPRPEHIAIPGYVYGGLIASLVDCHAIGTAAAAAYQYEGRAVDTLPALRFVTASLHIDYLKPTPLQTELELHARAVEIKSRDQEENLRTVRKVVVAVEVCVQGVITAIGKVVAVPIPERLIPGGTQPDQSGTD